LKYKGEERHEFEPCEGLPAGKADRATLGDAFSRIKPQDNDIKKAPDEEPEDKQHKKGKYIHTYREAL
jgi:hypothetical protein